MTPKRQSDIFKTILNLWKFYGLWFGRNPNKKHHYYSCVNICLNLVLFTVIFTINLWFAPRKVKYLIPEVIFYFTEIAVMSKVFMIIIMRDKILEAFNIMDGKDLDGDDEASKKIIQKDNAQFNMLWKFFITVARMAYVNLVFVPIILYFAIGTELKLLISQYYFLTDEVREEYFVYIFIYQCGSIYVHMIYNISIDTFVPGLLLVGVTQLRVLNYKFKKLKLSNEEKQMSLEAQDEIQSTKLRNLLKRYSIVLKYCKVVQEIINFNMFVVFGLSSVIICVTLCELLFMQTEIGFFCCMIMYLIAMLLQILLPAYFGTLINYESADLVFAAYCAEWIPRSEIFKRNLRVFIERAKTPIQITGLKMFIMSLATFTSMMKTAYSFFTLIRNFQD